MPREVPLRENKAMKRVKDPIFMNVLNKLRKERNCVTSLLAADYRGDLLHSREMRI
jgi:hypothetical protein